MKDLRRKQDGVPTGRRDLELQLCQFHDMKMGLALRYLKPEDQQFIRRNFNVDDDQLVADFLKDDAGCAPVVRREKPKSS